MKGNIRALRPLLDSFQQRRIIDDGLWQSAGMTCPRLVAEEAVKWKLVPGVGHESSDLLFATDSSVAPGERTIQS